MEQAVRSAQGEKVTSSADSQGADSGQGQSYMTTVNALRRGWDGVGGGVEALLAAPYTSNTEFWVWYKQQQRETGD